MTEIVKLLFTKVFQLQYNSNLFSYPKRWEIRICVSKENFPAGAMHLHRPYPADDRNRKYSALQPFQVRH